MQLDHSYSKNFAEEGNNSAPVPEETIVVSEEDSELGMYHSTIVEYTCCIYSMAFDCLTTMGCHPSSWE